MNKKTILLKAALGIYRVKKAESTLPDPIRARLEDTANKSKVLEAIKGLLQGSVVGLGAGTAGATFLGVGNGIIATEENLEKYGIPTALGGAVLGAPVGGLIGGIRGYLRTAREAEKAKEALDVDDWIVRQKNKQKGID